MSKIKFLKVIKDKKVKFSIASYHQPDGATMTDIKELAEKISKWEMGPDKLNFTRAGELTLLAKGYLELRGKIK